MASGWLVQPPEAIFVGSSIMDLEKELFTSMLLAVSRMYNRIQF
jgi:hypothetical protein